MEPKFSFLRRLPCTAPSTASPCSSSTGISTTYSSSSPPTPPSNSPPLSTSCCSFLATTMAAKYADHNDERSSVLWIDVMDSRLKERGRVNDVSPRGFSDICRNGTRAVDSYLQVFDMENFIYLTTFERSTTKRKHHDIVRLTDDGNYMILVMDVSLMVYRINTGKLVSNVCTHEKTTSLSLLDSGYAFVVGRSDGHILMMKLVDHDPADIEDYNMSATLEDRTYSILESHHYPEQKYSDNIEPVYSKKVFENVAARLKRQIFQICGNKSSDQLTPVTEKKKLNTKKSVAESKSNVNQVRTTLSDPSKSTGKLQPPSAVRSRSKSPLRQHRNLERSSNVSHLFQLKLQ